MSALFGKEQSPGLLISEQLHVYQIHNLSILTNKV